MAKTNAALGIELIGEEIRLALVERGEQGVTLHSIHTVKPGEELARAIRGLHRRPAAVTCAVGLENAGIRILSLPPTSDENLERVVVMEAESVLPFGSDELALSHQMLGMTDQSRMEVLVAAARQVAVQEALRRANCLPYLSATATVSSVALVNALQELRGSSREAGCAVLRIEERESELVVLERTRILAALLIPIGCATASAAEQPVPVAAGGGRVASAPMGLAAPELPWVSQLAQQVRYALQAVSYERALSIERLYLCGSGVTRPGAEWQLSERIDLPIAMLSPVEKEEGAGYTVAFGCAVQAAGSAVMPLNLTMPRVTVAREVEQRRQSRISWSALGGALLLSAGLVFGAAVRQKQQSIVLTEAELQRLGEVSLGPVASPGALRTAEKAITEALETRVTAAKALSLLSRQMPEGTWLAEISFNSETGCVVRGYSTESNGAQRAQIALLRQQAFDEVMLDYRTDEQMGKVQVWGFQLTCKLKPKERGRRGGQRR